MHVLFIPSWFETPAHPTSGKAIKDLALALRAKGLKINILFQSKETLPTQSILPSGIEVWHSQCNLKGKIYSYWNQASLNAYSRIFKLYVETHTKPDVIHVHGYSGLPIAVHLKNKFRIPFIYTEHSSKILQLKTNFIEHKIIRKLSQSAFCHTSVSSALGIRLQKITRTSNTIIPNTIDFNYFVPGSRGEDLIMINLLNKNKQVHLGIQAFNLWSQDHPTAKLHIIGDGPERKTLERQIACLPCKDQILLLGEIPSTRWLTHLQSALCLLHLSRSETFGVVALEALACKVPVISLQNGGIQDLAKLYPLQLLPLDANAELICKTINNTLHEYITEESRTVLKSIYDLPVVSATYNSLYSQAISTNS